MKARIIIIVIIAAIISACAPSATPTLTLAQAMHPATYTPPAPAPLLLGIRADKLFEGNSDVHFSACETIGSDTWLILPDGNRLLAISNGVVLIYFMSKQPTPGEDYFFDSNCIN